MTANPFEDTPAVAAPMVALSAEDGWVSFTFVNAPGYDRLAATVHGSPEYTAKLFAIEDFDGRISTLMNRATEIDRYFKGLAGPKAA